MEVPNAVLVAGRGLLVDDVDRAAELLGGTPISIPTPAYERFTYRRLFWNQLGKHYDAMPHAEVQEALTFMGLERAHPQRFSKKPQADA